MDLFLLVVVPVLAVPSTLYPPHTTTQCPQFLFLFIWRFVHLTLALVRCCCCRFDLPPLTTLIVWHLALIFEMAAKPEPQPVPDTQLCTPYSVPHTQTLHWTARLLVLSGRDNGRPAFALLFPLLVVVAVAVACDIIFTLLKTCSRNWFSASPDGTFQAQRIWHFRCYPENTSSSLSFCPSPRPSICSCFCSICLGFFFYFSCSFCFLPNLFHI